MEPNSTTRLKASIEELINASREESYTSTRSGRSDARRSEARWAPWPSLSSHTFTGTSTQKFYSRQTEQASSNPAPAEPPTFSPTPTETATLNPTPTESSENFQRLRESVEELVKASNDDRAAVDLDSLNECILKLKIGESSLESLEKRLREEIKTVNSNIFNASNRQILALETVKAAIASSSKRQVLAAAIQNCEHNSFPYFQRHEKPPRIAACDSKDLARRVLFSFQLGRGYCLPDDAVMERPDTVRWADKAVAVSDSKQRFRDRFCVQIFELTGVEPYVETEGKSVVYYEKW